MNDDLQNLLNDSNLLPSERAAIEQLLRATLAYMAEQANDAPTCQQGAATGNVEGEGGRPTPGGSLLDANLSKPGYQASLVTPSATREKRISLSLSKTLKNI